MKTARFLGLALAYCLAVMPLSAHAQYYTGVADIYFQSIEYPESFDQFIADNPGRFDKTFFTCLTSLESVWWPKAQTEQEICRSHLDPTWYNRCISENVYGPLVVWSMSLRATLAGTAGWPNTISGQQAVIGKTLAGGDVWVQIIEATRSLTTVNLLCQYR